jgi:glycosyltransferase involved in cell wall biosynthesis
MKICIVTHNVVKGDGQGRVNYEIALEAVRRNHLLILYATRVAPEIAAHPNVTWNKIRIGRWPTQLLKNQIFALKTSLALIANKKQYDVVVANGFITWVKSDINNIHFVHSAWQHSPAHPFRLKKNLFGIYQFIFTYLNSLLERAAFAKAEYLVPVSQKVERELSGIGLASPKIRVIPNGVDLNEFRPGPAGQDSRAALGLPEQVPLALFTGDIKSTRKNLDSVLKALVSVKNLHVAVAGQDKDSPFPAMAAELGVRERVHFLGFRRDIGELLRNVDFFVFPSRYETGSLVVMEALASALPVITTYESGVAELVEPGEAEKQAGFVLKHTEDVEGLRMGMQILTEQPEERRRMGIAARENAEERSWTWVSASYVNLFEEVSRKKLRENAVQTAPSSSVQ